ncbi:MAG: phytase, partial [Armatimonadota bacterium]
GLDGKVVQKVTGIDSPKGVDVQYGFKMGTTTVDLALVAEGGTGRCRIFTIDPKSRKLTEVSGSTGVFDGSKSVPQEVALYKSKTAMYAFVSRESSPKKGCLGQYQLVADKGKIDLKFTRSLGELADAKTAAQAQPAATQMAAPTEPVKPIMLATQPPEAAKKVDPAPTSTDGLVAQKDPKTTPAPPATTPTTAPAPQPLPAEVTSVYVDSSKARVYYTDPNYGVREYSADPDSKADSRTASGFARSGLAGMLHGLAMSKDHFVCLDQVKGGSMLRLFPRDSRGEKSEVARAKTEVDEAGSVEVVTRSLGKTFPNGLAVVTDPVTKTVQFYDWREIAKSAGIKG